MRFAALAAISVLGCASTPQVTAETESPYSRPLVTDQLPFLAERALVRSQQDQNDWCLRRTWDHSDEFQICDSHPYLNKSTPPMITVVRYDGSDRATAYAVFTPVPCRMYGKCDQQLDAHNVVEWELVDHDYGLRGDLVYIGENADHRDEPLLSMQRRMVDALTVELTNRFGKPVWRDRHQYGAAWSTKTADIGLFVIGHGDWVVETHELHHTEPPSLVPLWLR